MPMVTVNNSLIATLPDVQLTFIPRSQHKKYFASTMGFSVQPAKEFHPKGKNDAFDQSLRQAGVRVLIFGKDSGNAKTLNLLHDSDEKGIKKDYQQVQAVLFCEGEVPADSKGYGTSSYFQKLYPADWKKFVERFPMQDADGKQACAKIAQVIEESPETLALARAAADKGHIKAISKLLVIEKDQNLVDEYIKFGVFLATTTQLDANDKNYFARHLSLIGDGSDDDTDKEYFYQQSLNVVVNESVIRQLVNLYQKNSSNDYWLVALQLYLAVEHRDPAAIKFLEEKTDKLVFYKSILKHNVKIRECTIKFLSLQREIELLGMFYFEKNYKEAAEWFQMSITNYYSKDAQFRLAELVEKNTNEPHKAYAVYFELFHEKHPLAIKKVNDTMIKNYEDYLTHTLKNLPENAYNFLVRARFYTWIGSQIDVKDGKVEILNKAYVTKALNDCRTAIDYYVEDSREYWTFELRSYFPTECIAYDRQLAESDECNLEDNVDDGVLISIVGVDAKKNEKSDKMISKANTPQTAGTMQVPNTTLISTFSVQGSNNLSSAMAENRVLVVSNGPDDKDYPPPANTQNAAVAAKTGVDEVVGELKTTSQQGGQQSLATTGATFFSATQSKAAVTDEKTVAPAISSASAAAANATVLLTRGLDDVLDFDGCIEVAALEDDAANSFSYVLNAPKPGSKSK